MGIFATFFAWVGRTWTAASTLGKINMVLTAATLAVGVKGYMQQRAMLAKGQDILANKVAAGGKLPIVYGSRRTGAQIIYMDTAGNSSTHLYVVYAISVGECEEIMGSTIELSGNSLRDRKQFRNGGYIGTDKISSGSGSLCTANQNSGSVDLAAGSFGTNPALGGYRYVMNIHHGQASQTADPMLRASIGSQWTTAHRLDGVAYIACSFIYDAKGQFRGVPQLTVQVKGRKVFDPRDNSTAWSDNPALVMLDYITNSAYGKGLATSQINMSTFSVAANKADTLLDIPYFGGNTKPLNWSGSAGDNFITIGGSAANDTWWQNKVGNLIDLYDTNGNGIIDGKEISALQRDEFFDENPEFIVYFNGTLGGSYANQSGSYSAKSKRFHCNAYIDGNKTVMENARELLANMRGLFLYIDGKYELQIEDTGSSTFSINDSHIIGDSGISVDYGNKDAKANVVICEFFNANKRYEMDTATVYHTATTDANDYTSDDDGEILEIKAEFPHTTSAYIAYNHAKTILTRSRAQTSVQFLGTPEMYKLKIGDIVNLTYSGLGFNGKIFRVEAMQLQSGGLVSVSLLEYFDVYTWVVPPQEATEALTNIPSAYAVKAPASITFTDSDASSSDRPFLSWALPTDYPYYQWRVNVVDSGGVQQLNKIVDINNVDLNFIPVGANYVASITALNTMGVESNASTKTFTVGDPSTGTPDIKDGAITNIKVLNLSAAKINTGELNLGTASGMSVRQNKTGYSSNAAGFWLGNDGGTAKFNIGNSSSFLRWDGSALNIAGSIAATTGVIGGFTVGSNSLIAGSGTSRISLSTAAGIHLGNNTFGSAPFRVSLAGALVATNATISGAITATTLNVTNATVTGTLDASVITLNGEPLSNLMSYSSSGSGSITLLEVANINGDFVVNGNFEATGSQPDLVIGKVYNVSNANDRTIQADARLVSRNGDGSFKIQSQAHNNATLTTKASFSYTAFGNTTSLGTAGTLKINSGNALSLTLDTSQNATFTGEVTADAIQLPVQTPSSTTNKIYNVGGALYFNGAAVGGGGDGDITAVVAGTNLTGGGTSGSVTLNLANAISISGTIASGAITSSGKIIATQLDLAGDDVYIAYGSAGTAPSNGDYLRLRDVASGNDALQFYMDSSKLFSIDGQSGNAYHKGTISSGAITAPKHLLANAAYGMGVAQGNSGRFDTVDSGVNSDPLELVYYFGSGVIIGNGGGSKYLAAGSFQIGSTVVIDGSRNLTNIGNITSGGSLILNGIQAINKTGLNSAVALTINSDASTTSRFGLEVCNATSNTRFLVDGVGNSSFYGNNNAITARFTSDNKLGIGNASPTAKVTIDNSIATTYATTGYAATPSNSMLYLNNTHGGSNTASLINFRTGSGDGIIGFVEGGGTNDADFVIQTDGGSNGVERLRVLNNGDILFNKTAANTTATGNVFFNYGRHAIAVNATTCQIINRLGNDGTITLFEKDNANIGQINVLSGRMSIGSGDTGIFFNKNTNTIQPHNMTTNDGTNGISLGSSSLKFANLNLSGDATVGLLKIGSTTVLDGSRNLTNIGTIGSGAITSSGKIIATQLDLVGDDAYIAYGSAGTAPGNGDYLRLRDVASGNDALQFYMDSSKLFSIDGQSGNAFHKGTISGGTITTTGNLVGASNNTTEIGTYSSGAIKRIRMAQGGEIHFGDTTTSSFLGITEGAMNNFGDQDRIGIYYRNELKMYAGSNLLRHTFDISGNYTAVGQISAPKINIGANFGNAHPLSVSSGQRYLIGLRNTGATQGSSKYPWLVHDSDKFIVHWNAIGDKFSIDHSGNVIASGNVTAFSDERLKTNIETLDSKKALQMRGVSFIKDGVNGSGVIAQEIEKIAPELVHTNDDEMGTKSVAYGNLVGYLIETVKDQQKQIDELKELIGAA